MLVVVDEHVIVRAISRWLEGEGYWVKGVGSAEEAIELLKSESFDIILLDDGLPGMTGMRALSELPDYNPAPIIMISGHVREGSEEDALALGAKTFLKKPLDLNTLVPAIEEILGKG